VPTRRALNEMKEFFLAQSAEELDGEDLIGQRFAVLKGQIEKNPLQRCHRLLEAFVNGGDGDGLGLFIGGEGTRGPRKRLRRNWSKAMTRARAPSAVPAKWSSPPRAARSKVPRKRSSICLSNAGVLSNQTGRNSQTPGTVPSSN
jgi:hypothetical protein